jgi:hypothetical protein
MGETVIVPVLAPVVCPGAVPPVPPFAVGDGPVLAAGVGLLVATGGRTVTCGEESRAASFPAPADCSVAANVEVVAEPGAVALW